MKKFIKSVFLFLLIGILIGEIIVRVFSLNIDVVKSYLDKNNLIQNYPNQIGNYVNGTHKWIINKYGNPGYEPKSLDSLVTIVGDSYISNIMNPPECHQAQYLSDMVSKYNFYPSSRNGASFIEMMERAKSADYLNPKFQLIYVQTLDFIESIPEINKNPEMVQYSIKTGTISYAKLQYSTFKEVLYNLKFFYYLYRNFLINSKKKSTFEEVQSTKEKIDYQLIEKLLVLTKNRYNTKNTILVFFPDTDRKLVDIARRNGYRYFLLKANNYKSWQLKNNKHWSCFGHQEAAKQVASELLKMK